MKDQLTQYVNLLFAGVPQAADIKEEILQNTLDRYDDLIAQGKSPQAAYSLAISGIGDINEILGGDPEQSPVPQAAPQYELSEGQKTPVWKKILRAVAVALYIMCPIPLFTLQNEIGLCGLLAFVALATCLIVLSGKSGHSQQEKASEAPTSPKNELRKSINTLIWAIGLVLYFVVSFATGGWYITWVIFPMIGAVQGLVKACMDLKEAPNNEN